MKKIILFLIVLLTACSYENNNNKDIVKKIKIDKNREEKIEKVIGEASTDIIDSGNNRISNILIACEKINGIKLLEGEEFSFNKITGKKTTANGYKDAPVIVDGEKSYGIGGGVCQVSTTIYMAAINAGLDITEHYNHSEKVAYAPDGNDATVVYGVKDFKFVNNTGKNISLYVCINGKKVFAKIITE